MLVARLEGFEALLQDYKGESDCGRRAQLGLDVIQSIRRSQEGLRRLDAQGDVVGARSCRELIICKELWLRGQLDEVLFQTGPGGVWVRVGVSAGLGELGRARPMVVWRRAARPGQGM